MKRLLTASIVILASLGACQTIDEIPTDRLGNADLRFGNGLPAGTAQLLGSGTQVNISVGLIGLQPGSHAVRLHMIGLCDGPDFASAGNVLDPEGSQLGDLPDALIGSAGAGTVSATLPGNRLEVLAQLFDQDGSAVMIYEMGGEDPVGAGNRRIACGILTPR